MEARHGHGTDESGAEDVHFFVEAVIDHQVVRHADTVGFHGMTLAVVIVAYFGVVEVGDAAGVVATGDSDAAAGAGGGGDARGR